MNVVSLRWKVKREHVWLVFARGKMIFLHNIYFMLFLFVKKNSLDIFEKLQSWQLSLILPEIKYVFFSIQIIEIHPRLFTNET